MNPAEDGVTHVNIYSKGRTELGRWLSNWAYIPFIHPVYGAFNTIEGLWYYLQTTDGRRERLRTAQGYEAKELGRRLRQGKDKLSATPAFQRVIREAIALKVAGHPRLVALMRANVLPYAHYYVYENVVREPAEHRWVWDYVRELEQQLKGERV